MDTKRLDRIEIKNETRGEFSAVIATHGVVDSDGDVTEPGAFRDGQKVVVSAFGHSAMHGELPVGTGTLQVQKTRTVVNGRYFMDVPSAAAAFLTMKALHEQGLGEWSYGYRVVDAEMAERDGRRVRLLKALDAFEVSNVAKGAGVGTRTLAAKHDSDSLQEEARAVTSTKTAIKAHTTVTTDRPWDAQGMLAGLPEDASVSDLRAVHAAVDAAADPEAKHAYEFPHHHGVDGPANIRACVAGIAALNRRSDLPETARKGIYDHLAGHLVEADREPPALLEPGASAKNIDRLASLIDELGEVVTQIGEVGTSRAAKGKKLSSLTFEALGWAEEALDQVASEMKRLRSSPRDQAAAELARFIASQHHAG